MAMINHGDDQSGGVVSRPEGGCQPTYCRKRAAAGPQRAAAGRDAPPGRRVHKRDREGGVGGKEEGRRRQRPREGDVPADVG